MTTTDPGGWPAFFEASMHAAGFATASDLARETGISESVISRWLRGVTQPDVPNLRKIAKPLRVPVLKLLVAAGHISQEEARLRDVQPPKPTPVPDLLAAIEQDITLLDEAKEHLTNQYRLLLRIQPELSDTPRKTTPRRASTPRPDRRLRPVAHEGDPAHADIVDEMAREVRRQYEEGEGERDR